VHASRSIVEIETPAGLARAHLRPVADPAAALLLGHGAGGGIGARDLEAASAAAVQHGVSVALVEQPYRVAGRRSPAPARQLDVAWQTVVERLSGHELADLPAIVGGRSAGARVACRTAAASGAVAVLCLAFPLHPPGRADKTRLPELEQVAVPVLIVQGRSDPFGMPPPGPVRQVVEVAGNHSLTSDLDAVGGAVGAWLTEIVERDPNRRT
jgi:predicted alpha/beta-hydrolase family hydrolase